MNNPQAAVVKPKAHPPIPPRQPDGTTLLPLARIKKIIKVDDEITQCSAPATFLISVATEMFIQHLAAAGHAQSRLDGAKTLRYKDLANAVARRDDLEFLCDIIP
ncbi:histone-fold-containing protein, partial [Saitoella complicata NRRL Y-17804]